MLAQYTKHSMGQKNISNGWTVLDVGGQGLIMKSGQADLRHHEQVTTVPLFKENRRTTVSEITLTLGISYGSVTKLRTRRQRGIVHKRKLSSQMVSEGLYYATKYTLKQESQCTYNVTPRRPRASIVAVKK
jgi:hypothetical protein